MTVRTSIRAALTAAAVAVALVLPVTAARADDTICIGGLPPGTYDNVIVPRGGNCSIINSQIKGNVTALEASVLRVTGGTTIGGNLESDKAADVQIFVSTGTRNVVLGNITLKENSGVALVCGTDLPNGNIQLVKNRGVVASGGVGCRSGFGGGNRLDKGNLQVEDNVAQLGLDVFGNQVAQNLQVLKNRGSGSKLVQSNIVGATLACFENDPPFVGTPNTANKKEGQCIP